MRQLEREKALLQHKSLESHRKAESEADRKRCLENEGEGRARVCVLYPCALFMHFMVTSRTSRLLEKMSFC